VLVDGIVVEDRTDRLVGRNFTLDGIEKADEFLLPVALHAAPDDRAFQDIEAANRVVVPPAFALGHAQISQPGRWPKYPPLRPWGRRGSG